MEVSEDYKLTYLTQEVNMLVTAGSETTASVLEVGLFRVLQNKDIYEKLFEELKEAIPNVNEAPKLAMLKQLPYLVSTHPVTGAPRGCLKSCLYMRSFLRVNT